MAQEPVMLDLSDSEASYRKRLLRKRLLIGCIYIPCLACIVLCGVKWGYPALLTLLHGKELQQALEAYWNLSHSAKAYEDPDCMRDVATGDFLEWTIQAHERGPSDYIDDCILNPSCKISCKAKTISVNEFSSQCSSVLADVSCAHGSIAIPQKLLRAI
jgi:hypothetical protein